MATFTEVGVIQEHPEDQEQLARDLAAQFRRLRCRANELIVQLGVLCERVPGEEELHALAAGLKTPHRCDLFTRCVNLEVSLQEAQKWSGRVLAAVAAAQAEPAVAAKKREAAPTPMGAQL